jgi:hypothetical protein
MHKTSEARYRITRTLEDGQEVFVANRQSLVEATDLINGLRECWPGHYWVQVDNSGERIPNGNHRSEHAR